MNFPNQVGTECLIWPGHPAIVFSVGGFEQVVENSPRAGGNYATGPQARLLLNEIDDERHKARITTYLVNQRRMGVDWPQITESIIEEARVARGLTADERAERLVGFLAQQTTNLGTAVWVPHLAPWLDDASMTDEYYSAYHALAISESSVFGELVYLLDYLMSAGWIELENSGAGTLGCTVTVEGYRRIAEQEVNPSSDQVFVAMWFDPSMEAAYEEGIRPAIVDTGYESFRIDRKPDVDKIDDEIIGEIRRSRFLIADFTYGDKGIRGGVYYEAGFALGLGLEVIRSCRADQIDDLHFDVNHHYHIAWNTPEQLREGLERRILALVGEGPNRENIPPGPRRPDF